MSRVQLEISLGILMVLATGTILIYQGLREQDNNGIDAISNENLTWIYNDTQKFNSLG